MFLKPDLDWSVAFSSGSPGDVCVSIETSLPKLAVSLRDFIRGVGGSKSFPGAAPLMIEYVDSFIKIQLEKKRSL